MKRVFLLLAVIPSSLLAGKSDPGAPLIAADEAYAKDVQTRGEWPAALRLALPESETFTPYRVKVIKVNRGNIVPPPRRFKPEQAWISCDDTVGVTFGRWEFAPYNLRGWYESIWVRMRDGSFKILLRRGGTEPRMLHSKPGRKGMRAACGGKPPPLPILAPDVGTDFKMGASSDQTVVWSSAVSPEGGVRIVISLWNGKAFMPVLEDVAPAPIAR